MNWSENPLQSNNELNTSISICDRRLRFTVETDCLGRHRSEHKNVGMVGVKRYHLLFGVHLCSYYRQQFGSYLTGLTTSFRICLIRQVPGMLLPVLESIMKAQTTESEKTDIHVFSVYISIASVKENRARFSAQFRSRSASAAYNALPCNT